jgi:hypothetical protein
VGEAIGALPGRGPHVTAAALAGAAAHRGRLGVGDGDSEGRRIGGMDPGSGVRGCCKLQQALGYPEYILARKPIYSPHSPSLSLNICFFFPTKDSFRRRKIWVNFR